MRFTIWRCRRRGSRAISPERGEPQCADAVDIAAGFFENDEGTYYNSALYLHVDATRERIVHLHRKMFLPTYGVFDEERFLSRGHKVGVFETRFGRMALLVCEDACHAIVPTIAAIKGARILIVPSASPGRGIEKATASSRASRSGARCCGSPRSSTASSLFMRG